MSRSLLENSTQNVLPYCSFVPVRDAFATKGCLAPFIPNRSRNSIQACGGSSVVKSPGDLREQAKRLRRLAPGIADRRTLEAIAELAAECGAVAAAVERFNLVRKRAYQIWEEQGRPEGLHADHWRDAELQVAEDQRNEGQDHPALGKP